MYMLPSNVYFVSIISIFVIVNTTGLFYIVFKIWIVNLKNSNKLIKFFYTTALIVALLGIVILFKSMFELWIEKYQDGVLLTFLNSLLIISTFLLVVFGVAYLTLKKELERKIYEYKKLEETQLLLKLESVKSKYNPHFLFNALAISISMIDLDEEKGKVKEYLMNITDLLRASLEAPEIWTVEEELELVKKYLEVQEKRYGKRLSFEIKLSPECLRKKIPALVLQPLVENAIVHGISRLSSGGNITINCAPIEKGGYFVEVQDNGFGINYLKKGTGLKIVEERIKLFSSNAKIEYISMEGKGTKVILTIPENTE